MLDKDLLRKLGVALGMSFDIFILSLAGMAVGYGLDRWLKSSQYWATVVFAIFGLIAGFYKAYKTYERLDQEKF